MRAEAPTSPLPERGDDLARIRPATSPAGNRPAGQPAVNPRIICAVSRGTSSWGQWPTPSSSTQSAWGSQSSR